MQDSKYQQKFKLLRTEVRHLIYENAALLNQLTSLENEIKSNENERYFLLEKLFQFENLSDKESLVKNIAEEANNKKGKIKTTKKTISSLLNNNNRKKNRSSETSNIFPVKLTDLIIQSIGKLKLKNFKSLSEDTIYPIGYLALRSYADFNNPDIKCTYTCKISSAGSKPTYARFELTHNPSGTVFEAYSSNDCHRMLLEKINATLKMAFIKTQPKGDEFFGLQHPTVSGLLQHSLISKSIQDYNFKNNVAAVESYERSFEMDPSLSFKALQSTLKYSKNNYCI